MTDHSSPEERLLRLIRGRPKKPKEASSPPKAKEYIATGSRKTPDFYKIGIVLSILVIVTSVGYTIFESMLPQPNLEIRHLSESVSSDEIDKEPIETLSPKPYSYYSEYIDSRDIFQADFLSKKASDGSLDTSLEGKLSDLTLVGIVLDEIPQAVFEHEEEKKTYFLKEGESIGDVKVEEILEGRVTVSFEDEEFELKP